MAKVTYQFFLLFSFMGFSQTEKLLHGKILSEQTALSNIDIVNMNSKKSVTSDSDGNFSIQTKVGEELFIISKEYTDRKIILTQEQLNNNHLIIYLEKKPIELEDVEILKKQSLKVEIKQSDIDAIKLSKQARTLKVPNVYTGEIENGIDFVRIGKGLSNLFKKKDQDKPQKQLPPVLFKEYLAANFDSEFYTQKLNLKPEEIALFISFCEADPKSEVLSKHQDILEVLGFLISKNEAFKKLAR